MATRVRLRAYQLRGLEPSASAGTRGFSPSLTMSWFSTQGMVCQEWAKLVGQRERAMPLISTEAVAPCAAWPMAERMASRRPSCCTASKRRPPSPSRTTMRGAGTPYSSGQYSAFCKARGLTARTAAVSSLQKFQPLVAFIASSSLISS
jgi:hypothetical protein